MESTICQRERPSKGGGHAIYVCLRVLCPAEESFGKNYYTYFDQNNGTRRLSCGAGCICGLKGRGIA